MNFALGQAGARSRRRQKLTAEEGFRVRKALLGGYKLKLGDADIDFRRDNRDPQQADLADMRAFDRDNNGYIDQNEAEANQVGKTVFAAMDVDGDGKVVKAEFSTFMARCNAAAAARIQLEVTDRGQDLFVMLDADGDGVLSPRELRHAREVLNAADKNQDGALNGDELPQLIELVLSRGVADTPETRTQVAAARSATKANSVGPTWFRKMDRNNDGDLSESEFIGPIETFRKLDADGDGLVDREEAEAAGK